MRPGMHRFFSTWDKSHEPVKSPVLGKTFVQKQLSE